MTHDITSDLANQLQAAAMTLEASGHRREAGAVIKALDLLKRLKTRRW